MKLIIFLIIFIVCSYIGINSFIRELSKEITEQIIKNKGNKK